MQFFQCCNISTDHFPFPISIRWGGLWKGIIAWEWYIINGLLFIEARVGTHQNFCYILQVAIDPATGTVADFACEVEILEWVWSLFIFYFLILCKLFFISFMNIRRCEPLPDGRFFLEVMSSFFSGTIFYLSSPCLHVDLVWFVSDFVVL